MMTSEEVAAQIKLKTLRERHWKPNEAAERPTNSTIINANSSFRVEDILCLSIVSNLKILTKWDVELKDGVLRVAVSEHQ